MQGAEVREVKLCFQIRPCMVAPLHGAVEWHIDAVQPGAGKSKVSDASDIFGCGARWEASGFSCLGRGWTIHRLYKELQPIVVACV